MSFGVEKIALATVCKMDYRNRNGYRLMSQWIISVQVIEDHSLHWAGGDGGGDRISSKLRARTRWACWVYDWAGQGGVGRWVMLTIPRSHTFQTRTCFECRMQRHGNDILGNTQPRNPTISFLIHITPDISQQFMPKNDDIEAEGNIGEPIVPIPFSPSLFIRKLECFTEYW